MTKIKTKHNGEERKDESTAEVSSGAHLHKINGKAAQASNAQNPHADQCLEEIKEDEE